MSKKSDADNSDSDNSNSEDAKKNRSSSSSSSSSCDSSSSSSELSNSDSSASSASKSKRKSCSVSDVDTRTKSENRDPSAPSQSKSSDDNSDSAIGIRRSSRSKRQRLKSTDTQSKSKSSRKGDSSSWNSASSNSEDSEDENSAPPRSKRLSAVAARRPKPPPRRRASGKRNRNSDSSEESSGSDYEDELNKSSKRGTAASRRSRAVGKVSYKEASEDEGTNSEDLIEYDQEQTQAREEQQAEEEKCETIERILAFRRGKKKVTGNITTIYAVEENGDPNDGADQLPDNELEEQYQIKWKGWAHIHNTWESEQSIREQKVKGMKKLENFAKKEAEIQAWKRLATPEDLEYFDCQLELQMELLKSYNYVERIFAEYNKPDGGRDYYVKWESLPYADATWEDSSLVEKKWPDKVREFHEREDSKRTPSKTRVLKYRPKFHEIKVQPDFMGVDRGLILRDYQMDGLNWLVHSWCKDNSVILADEMGLGKTIQTICFLYYLFNTQQLYGPFLCVVPLSTMTSWQREFRIWAPELNIVTYLGDTTSRDIIRQFEWCFESTKKMKFNAILTTYEIVLKDKALLGGMNWAILLVDEAHRLKNDDSLLYKALMEFSTNLRLLITGTPLQNSLKELWALLHFIMPTAFETWETFEVEHANAATKGYTKLHKQLEPFILRRVKKDVEKSLPAKVEQILRVEMTSVQKKYYKWILTKNYNALRKGIRGSTNTFCNIVIELKKCCNHALLTKPVDHESINPNEDQLHTLLRGSGKLVLLDKLLTRLRETGHRVLIFSQMVRMLDILSEYLQMRHFPYQRLDGSIKGELRKQALDHFNADNSQDFCFLLSTRAGGLGINLATADTVIIYDSDWNPQNDLQAQARAHRIGQKNQVNIYRLVTAQSVEEEIVERAKQKMVLDHLVIQRMDTTGRTVLNGKASSSQPFNKEELTAILKFGAEELFKDEEDKDEEPTCDIDEILQRAETRDEAPTMAGDELLSAFKVATFSAFDEDKDEPVVNDDHKDWDDIIPESIRKKVDEQEKNKEMEDLYLPPRNRKTVQQMSQFGEHSEDERGERRKKRSANNEETDDNSSDSNDDRPKKRGRPTTSARERIKGFTDIEIRRFVKSYKKFASPLTRLEAIACDAELQEKPLAELKKLGETLRERVLSYMNSTEPDESATNDGAKKQRARGPSFKLGGVSVNAKTMMQCERELQPLEQMLPNTNEERLKWSLVLKTKPAHFDCEWADAEDSKLLVGIYQYGLGSWEQIKMDPSLGINDKINLDSDKKPQAKHLLSRCEYLLKVIKRHLDKTGKTSAKPKKQRRNKEISNEIVDSSSDERATVGKKKTKTDKTKHDDEAGTSKKEKKSKQKKQEGPMHFTANNEPQSLDILGGLDPSVFNQCKEMMRPVKKSLKAIDNPDDRLSESEQLNHTRQCLFTIGSRIDECLKVYEKDPLKVKEWRSNLWYFVSKFTNYDARKLYKIYKHTLKKMSAKDEAEPPAKDKKTKKREAIRDERVTANGQDKKKRTQEATARTENDVVTTKKSKHRDTYDKSTAKERDKSMVGDMNQKRRSDDMHYKPSKRLHREKLDRYDMNGMRNGPSNSPVAPLTTLSSRGPAVYRNELMASDPRVIYNDGTIERWNATAPLPRDRYSQRDRYETYSRASGYHRERSHRERLPDKKRYYHHEYADPFMSFPAGAAPGAYKERFTHADWHADLHYRADYHRDRPPM